MSKLAVTVDDQTFEVELELSRQNGNGFEVRVNGQPVRVRLPDRETTAEQMEWIVVDDKPYEIVIDRDMGWIRSHSRNHLLEVRDLETPIARPQSRDARVKAPIPGQVTQVLVTAGQYVQSGQPLLLLEAMKMENEIRAPRSGRVSIVHVSPGQTVSLNEVLAEIS